MLSELLGFDKIKKSLLDEFKDHKLHHGLLFFGNKGIGKASFVFNLATQIILSSSENKIDDLRKIESGSHPDLLVITKEEKKRDITIDALRELNGFLNLTAAISNHRVVIIDAIDDLNRNSSNAILKTLEEPPANVFLFLINHNSSKVLDTIKSRCRLIKVYNPNYQTFKEVLEKNIEGVGEEEVKILAKISDNSIGSALEIYNYSALDLYEQIYQLILENDHKSIVKLSKTISDNEDIWNIFEKLIIFYLHNLLAELTSKDGNSQNENAKENIFTVSDKITKLFSDTKNLNLDKSQSIINIFAIIKNARY